MNDAEKALLKTEIVEILKDEASELAGMQFFDPWKQLSRRARLAIVREQQRLRRLADGLEQII